MSIHSEYNTVVGSGQPELFSVSITQWTARAEYHTVVGTSGQPELFSVSITWLLAVDRELFSVSITRLLAVDSQSCSL